MTAIDPHKPAVEGLAGWTERETIILPTYNTFIYVEWDDSRIVWVTHFLPVSLQLVIHSFCPWPFSQAPVDLLSPVSPLE